MPAPMPGGVVGATSTPIDATGDRGPDDAAGPVLARVASRESSARSYSRRLPLVLARAEGAEVTDTEGRVYLDFLAGAGALPLGHRHPVAVEAVQRALADGVPWTTLDLPTPVKDAFVTELLSTLPPELARGRIQFCSPSGADAVEAALKLVKTATGRTGLVGFGGGYHGMTQGTLALAGTRQVTDPLGPLLPDVHHVPFPAEYRCPFGAGGRAGEESCARVLGWLLDDDRSGAGLPAGVVLEPVQGEGGVNPASPWFLREVRRLTAGSGVPLVLDEVQTGLGRTGTLWAFEHAADGDRAAVPDVLVLSKAIGGGLPLAVVVYREELDAWTAGAHAGTFRGNQLALAAGAATIRHVREEGLAGRAADLGARLLAGLRAVTAGIPEVAEVRGRGLLVGVELVDPDQPAGPDPSGPARPDGDLARRVQRELLALGFITEVGGPGGAVSRFLPPLTVTEEQVDRAVDAYGTALRRARRSTGEPRQLDLTGATRTAPATATASATVPRPRP